MTVNNKLFDFDMEMIDVLTSEYTGVYIVDLRNGEAKPYSIDRGVESEVGDIFEGSVRYVDAYRTCVETLVLDDDRKMMMQVGTTGNIMSELRNKRTFCTVYRNNEGKYCEMKFIKMGDTQGLPEKVALCFSERDEELRKREEDTRRLRRNLDIIGILASEYTSVFYIDMNTDELDTYQMNEQTENEFGRVFREGIKYSTAFRMYVDMLVYPEDREMMMRAGSVFNILDELSNKKTFVTRYRNTEGRYCEMKFVKVGDDEFPQAVALGFSDRDDEIKEEVRLERRQKVFSDMIEDFACVNYIDINADPDNNTTAFRTSEVLKRLIPGWENEMSFRKRMLRMSELLVSEEEKKHFFAETKKEHVLEVLKSELAHYVRFFANVDGKTPEYEFKFTADKNPDGVIKGIVAGLHRVRT